MNKKDYGEYLKLSQEFKKALSQILQEDQLNLYLLNNGNLPTKKEIIEAEEKIQQRDSFKLAKDILRELSQYIDIENDSAEMFDFVLYYYDVIREALNVENQ